MEDYIGKICPFCKTEIKEGEDVKVCPACGIAHHAACWEENNGCTTFGCSEQHHEEQHTNPTSVCANCGAPLGDGQAFCPKCGAPKAVEKKTVCGKCGTELQDDQAFCPKCGAPREKKKPVCSKCGAELEEGQDFCPKCGQKADLQIDSNVNSAISQFNSNVEKTKQKSKKKPIMIGGIIGAIVIVGVIIVLISGTKKPDFNKMYSDIATESWCTIGSDGTYMKIDTNPYDIDDHTEISAYYKIKSINEDLGFSSSLFEEMGETRALDGRQTASSDKYEVSWSYHPDNGLEVMYKIKN